MNMRPIDIAAQPGQADAEWLTAILRRAGALGAGRVKAIEAKRVGNGLLGDSYRFALNYEGSHADAPATVVGKFPASDPASRATGAVFAYKHEIAFYRELAHRVKIITPRCYFAEIDPESGNFTLILEDLAPARAGDHLAGCSADDAETALLEAAALHAPVWGKLDSAQYPWLDPSDATVARAVPLMPSFVATFKERYTEFEPELMRLVERLPAATRAMSDDRLGPQTLVHGDFRLDNILFDIQGGARRMGTLDWQCCTLGAGLTDVSYFLGAGFSPERRRQHERDLVQRYHAELLRLGVEGYDWEQCWYDYRRFALYGVVVGIFAAASVQRTDRGDAVFLKMARDSCLQALDHGSFDLWKV